MKPIAQLLRNIAGKARSGVVGRVNRSLGNDTSKSRVLLEKLLPGLDKATSGQSFFGADTKASNVLAALGSSHLGSAAGTGRAITNAAKRSFKSGEGVMPGVALGAPAGGIGGAMTAGDDSRESFRRFLIGSAIGGLGGAAGGLGGAAALRGIGAGAKHYGSRMRAWTDLAGKGITPSVTITGGRRGKGLEGVKSVKDFLNLAKEHKGSADIIQLSNKGSNPAEFMQSLGRNMGAAGVNTVNAGTMVNPRMPSFITNPRFLQNFRNRGIERVHGDFAHDAVMKLDPRQRKGVDNLLQHLTDTKIITPGNAHIARRSSERGGIRGLLEDLKPANRVSNKPISEVGTRVDQARLDGLLDSLSPLRKRRIGLGSEGITQAVKRRIHGTDKIDRLWGGTDSGVMIKQPFDVTTSPGAQIVRPAMRNLRGDASPQTLRKRLADANPQLSRRGLNKEWGSMKPYQRQLGRLSERLRGGERLDVSREVAKILGVRKSELPVLFPKPTPRSRPVSMDNGKVIDIGSAKATNSPSFKPRQGDVWDIMVGDVRNRIRNGRSIRDIMVPWGQVKSKLGLSTRDLRADAGVTNASDWEAFKRAVVSAASGIRKAAFTQVMAGAI